VHHSLERIAYYLRYATGKKSVALGGSLLQQVRSWFISNPCFMTYCCLHIFHCQPSTLLEPCLSLISVIVVSPVLSCIPPCALITLVNRQGYSNTKIVLSILCHVSMISLVTLCIHPVLSSKRISSSIAPMINLVWNLRKSFSILSICSS
jgi:cytochrome bd-type quinol oxidase subunit 2